MNGLRGKLFLGESIIPEEFIVKAREMIMREKLIKRDI